MRVPSGDHVGDASGKSPSVICVGAPPATGTTKMCGRRSYVKPTPSKRYLRVKMTCAGRDLPRSSSRSGSCHPPTRVTKARRVESGDHPRSEEHTSELQSPCNLVCRLLLEKKKEIPSAGGGAGLVMLDCPPNMSIALWL